MRYTSLFIALLVFAFIWACDSGEKQPETGSQAVEEETALVIYGDSFVGISPGDRIADHADLLRKDVFQTGEGDFDIYRIDIEGRGSAGYLFPDPNDESLVGDIVVTSPAARTEDSLQIGMTFGQLQERYDDLKVHGSEIEGRTDVYIGGLALRLGIPLWSYEVDVSEIPDSTEVIEISVRR